MSKEFKRIRLTNRPGGGVIEPVLSPGGPLGLFPGQPGPRLYDRAVRRAGTSACHAARSAAALRARHYSRRTETAYVHWIRRFILFHRARRPREVAEGEVNRFLTHLAMNENVAASTQNQALAAVLFLYEHVLEQPLHRIEGVVRARRPRQLPAALTRDQEPPTPNTQDPKPARGLDFGVTKSPSGTGRAASIA